MASPARQRILDAALGLIRERGIGRVTTKEIALAADAAKGSLFKSFGDKTIGAAHRAAELRAAGGPGVACPGTARPR